MIPEFQSRDRKKTYQVPNKLNMVGYKMYMIQRDTCIKGSFANITNVEPSLKQILTIGKTGFRQ